MTKWIENHISLHGQFTQKEEMENAWTHFAGGFLGILGLVLIIARLGDVTSLSLRVGLVVFGITNVLLYFASAFYHYLKPSIAKRVCRLLDHSNIYFLIAGTYTPILLYVGSSRTIALTVFIWLIAVMGILFSILFWGRFKILHTVLYLLMGWVIVFFWNDIIPYLPNELVFYLLCGGITYSAGVLFYAIKKIPHYHAIWHIFVLFGSLWFYCGIYGQLI